jgi:hypothetical protein
MPGYDELTPFGKMMPLVGACAVDADSRTDGFNTADFYVDQLPESARSKIVGNGEIFCL